MQRYHITIPAATPYAAGRAAEGVFSVKVEALALTVALAALPARADAPRVAADIPPVHSLVARVMQGVGEPALILPPGASPHGYAMRPSEAAALAGAAVVVRMGDTLTPWLGRAVDALSPEAVSLDLLETEGTTLLGYREGAAFGHHDHSAEADRDAPDHASVDPHAWLDPGNAKVWLGAIATSLAEADPGNAVTYARNAAAGRAELDALIAELSETLEPVRGRPFIVFHDAFHYFEHGFGVEAAGAITLGDGSSPGPARIADIREAIRQTGATCVFTEPQFAPDLIETVVEGTGARMATLDPLGAALPPGPDLYPRLLRGLAHELADCLDPGP